MVGPDFVAGCYFVVVLEQWPKIMKGAQPAGWASAGLEAGWVEFAETVERVAVPDWAAAVLPTKIVQPLNLSKMAGPVVADW